MRADQPLARRLLRHPLRRAHPRIGQAVDGNRVLLETIGPPQACLELRPERLPRAAALEDALECNDARGGLEVDEELAVAPRVDPEPAGVRIGEIWLVVDPTKRLDFATGPVVTRLADRREQQRQRRQLARFWRGAEELQVGREGDAWKIPGGTAVISGASGNLTHSRRPMRLS